MKKLIYMILLMAGGALWAQAPDISPQVINSAGSTYTTSTGLSVTDNVGEALITTINNGATGLMLSQGFIQPFVMTAPLFTVDIFVTDVTCSFKNDGRISTAITATGGKYEVKYLWTPTVVCPGNNCQSIDSLKAGTYSLSVVITYTNSGGKPVTDTLDQTITQNKFPLTVTDVNGPCKIKVFSGVTLNSDGVNDVIFIENISEFPNNRMSVYNRWGAQLFDQKGYNNTTVSWPTPDEANKLVSGTYFYILDLGDGSKPIKGWIELIKN